MSVKFEEVSKEVTRLFQVAMAIETTVYSENMTKIRDIVKL